MCLSGLSGDSETGSEFENPEEGQHRPLRQDKSNTCLVVAFIVAA